MGVRGTPIGEDGAQQVGGGRGHRLNEAGDSLTVFAARDLWIDAEVEQVRGVREWAARAAHEFGFGHDACYEIKLAITEAVANAIQHGSPRTGDAIRVSIHARGNALVFDVLDTGVFSEAGEPLEELAERGRGLAIVGSMMDAVELTPERGGTLLRFVKRRNGCSAG